MGPVPLQNTSQSQVDFYDLHPPAENLQAEIRKGLHLPRKALPPKLFYDNRGSVLFDEICRLEEYYLTRTEIGILRRAESEIAEIFREPCMLVEYGCGNSEKVRMILDRADGCHAYAAVDISRKPLLDLSTRLALRYEQLEVIAICADFTKPLDIPFAATGVRRIAFFPGSSIGNFEPAAAVAFLRNVACTVGRNGGLLIGVDLKKDPRILHAAYNDTRGVTAQFNKNLLERINRECPADLDLSVFEHRAHYDATEGRVEMHLACLQERNFRVGDLSVHFDAEETIHTENSYKYHPADFQALAAKAGWNLVRHWTDPERLFGIFYLEVF